MSNIKKPSTVLPFISYKIIAATTSNYKPTKIKWARNEDGTERKLEIPKRIRRWWTEQQGGTILLTIRYGNKVIEFEEGKNAIELPSKAELEPTIQSIKQAVDNGEFDRLFEEQLAYGSRLNRKKI
jgi:hypothetical protein